MQGINFRWSTRKKAKGLKLMGFVRNQPDGSVYIEVEGELTLLSEFLEWCKKGPFWSKVEKITVDEAEMKNYTGFEIKY